MIDEHVRGCPSCGWLAETLDEWAHHMVNVHEIDLSINAYGEWEMSYPMCEARA